MRFFDWASLHYHLLWAYSGPVPEVALEGTYTDSATSCWLLRKGSVRLKSSGSAEVTASAGDWVFVASPTRYQRFSSDAEILSLHFQLYWPGREPVVDRQRNLVVPAEKIPLLEKAVLRVARLLERHFPEAHAFLPDQPCSRSRYLKVQAAMPPLLDAYLEAQETIGNRPRSRTDLEEHVLHTIVYIDQLPPDRLTGVAEVAKVVGLSRPHLDTLFLSNMGMTPMKYMEQRRLSIAEEMLKRTHRSVKEIAHALGFRHPSHFCSWFRRLRNTRPSEYRQKERGN